jgi:phosphoribosyl 1,2-cyclic phosphodiesterase
MRRIARSLRDLGLELSELSGVLITHEHSDHISGLAMLSKYYRVPVYAPRKAAAALCELIPVLDGLIRPFEAERDFEIRGMNIHSFRTPHDTPESVGYKISSGKRAIAVATDLGFVPDSVIGSLIGADAVILEANHDIEMLRCGPYPAFLKKRILSDRGHLSNEVSGYLARRLVEGGMRQIVLAHLSKENNLPQLAYSTVDNLIRAGDTLSASDFLLSVAPRDNAGRRYTV